MVVYEHELPNPNKYIGSQKTKMAPPVFFAFFSKLIFFIIHGLLSLVFYVYDFFDEIRKGPLQTCPHIKLK